ncbi:TetR/AcrR family transcriptional regulator [Bacteroidota bacterium]
MPLKTFYNLPKKRRLEIIDAAYEEFALHEYRNASINNIVSKLNIAKGSFYRYFTNKKDLYFYLITYAEKMRFEQVDALLSGKEMDFFDLITENFAMKIKFDMEFPLYSAFLYNVMQEKNNDDLGNIQLQIKQRILDIVVKMLAPRIEQKEIRSNLSVFDMAYLVIQVQWGIYDYLEIKYGVNFRENARNKRSVFTIPKEEILKDVKSFSMLLRNGMRN